MTIDDLIAGETISTSGYTFASTPVYKSYWFLNNDDFSIRFLSCNPRPNWWRRFWYWWLLGIRWRTK